MILLKKVSGITFMVIVRKNRSLEKKNFHKFKS